MRKLSEPGFSGFMKMIFSDHYSSLQGGGLALVPFRAEGLGLGAQNQTE